MSSLPLVRDLTTADYPEEAAVQALDRLLLLHRRSKGNWSPVLSKLGISPRTFSRWCSRGHIPLCKLHKVFSRMGWDPPVNGKAAFLSGPKELAKASAVVAPWAQAARGRLEKQMVGYAAVWLSSHIPATVTVDCTLGSPAAPASRVTLYAEKNIPKAHVTFLIHDHRMCYQAFGPSPSSAAQMVMEGMADQLSFDFCREYLSWCTKQGSMRLRDIEAKMQAEIKKHHENFRDYKDPPGEW